MDTETAVKAIKGMIELEWRRQFPPDLATYYIEALEMAVEALRRQETMKVTSVGEHYPYSNCDTLVDYDCPNCGEIITFEYLSQDEPDCCPWCGQSLDWRK